MFLGTPHQGARGVTLLAIMNRVLSVVSHTNNKLVGHLQPNSDFLHDLQERYNSISTEFDTTFLYETQEMTVPVLGRVLASFHPLHG